MPLLVLKFGGTSVGSCDKIIKVAKLVKQYYDQKNKVIVVSSAMSGATDDLIKKSKKIAIHLKSLSRMFWSLQVSK